MSGLAVKFAVALAIGSALIATPAAAAPREPPTSRTTVGSPATPDPKALITIRCRPGGNARITLSNLNGRAHRYVKLPPVYWMVVVEYAPARRPIESRPLAPGECGLQTRGFPASTRTVSLYGFMTSAEALSGDQGIGVIELIPSFGHLNVGSPSSDVAQLVRRSSAQGPRASRAAGDYRLGEEFAVSARPAVCFNDCGAGAAREGDFIVEAFP